MSATRIQTGQVLVSAGSNVMQSVPSAGVWFDAQKEQGTIGRYNKASVVSYVWSAMARRALAAPVIDTSIHHLVVISVAPVPLK